MSSQRWKGEERRFAVAVGAHCAHFCTVGSPAEWGSLASFEMQSAKAVAKAERVSGVASPSAIFNQLKLETERMDSSLSADVCAHFIHAQYMLDLPRLFNLAQDCHTVDFQLTW